MECSRERRSMVKLAALCLAVAVSLSLWCVCGASSGFRHEGGPAVVLRSDLRRRASATCANPGRGCSGAGGDDGGQRRRRRLRSSEGPGSYPPRCTNKCGECNPCYPVHVAVPPGVPVTTEYYPEAWRCRCGNRLYMP